MVFRVGGVVAVVKVVRNVSFLNFHIVYCFEDVKFFSGLGVVVRLIIQANLSFFIVATGNV